MSASRSLPAKTFFVGLALTLVAEILLYCDVRLSGRGTIETQQAIVNLSQPLSPLANLARWVAIFMTPIAWFGYILLLDGLLAHSQSGSPVRRRPHAFAFCCLSSIVIWCVFDVINFYCFSPPAWTYIVPPLNWPRRFVGYVVAFAAELPAMFMTGQIVFDICALDRLRSRPWKLPSMAAAAISIAGMALLAWAVLGQNAVANYGLWCSFFFLLDPINMRLGQPSLLQDWQEGRYHRTLALFSGGLCCGLLWEFWNYWALSKWIYHLPFLGAAERIKYFEMPIAGLAGFLPFSVACWAMWQTAAIPLRGLVEPLPDDHTIL
jgi:hypothetical protein